MPAKRHEKRTIDYLTRAEIEAVIAAPDLSTWHGRRDRALLAARLADGPARLGADQPDCDDIVLGTGAHVRCMGKGRKERAHADPQGQLQGSAQLAHGARQETDPSLFVSNRGERLSRDAVEHIVRKYVEPASRMRQHSKGKRVTPHVLRHSAAMQLLQNGVDRTVIALWLGHEFVETTQMYIHADIKLKEKAMARTQPVKAPPGRYRPDDKLLAFLEAL